MKYFGAIFVLMIAWAIYKLSEQGDDFEKYEKSIINKSSKVMEKKVKQPESDINKNEKASQLQIMPVVPAMHKNEQVKEHVTKFVKKESVVSDNTDGKVSEGPRSYPHSDSNDEPKGPISKTARTDGLWKTPDGKEPTYDQRIDSLEKMGKNLNQVERAELYSFLRHGPNDKFTLHVKDEIMIKIEQQGTPAPEYIGELRSIVADEGIDGDLRGYAAQHLRSAYVHATDEERKEIRETFYEGLKDNETDVSGTSLLSVINLHERFGEFEDDKIDEAALELSTSDNTHLPSKITAMSLVGERGLVQVLPSARDQAIKGVDTVMKIASIATLGELGTQEDLEILDKILNNHSKSYYHEAAELSKTKIKKRLNL